MAPFLFLCFVRVKYRVVGGFYGNNRRLLFVELTVLKPL